MHRPGEAQPPYFVGSWKKYGGVLGVSISAACWHVERSINTMIKHHRKKHQRQTSQYNNMFAAENQQNALTLLIH